MSRPTVAVERLRRSWDDLARVDPMWAILTVPARKFGGWAGRTEEFFASGRRDVKRALRAVQRLGIDLRMGRALDFGCGIGRLTQALAERFEQVDGVDISAEMVRLARRHNRFGDRCRYTLNARPDLRLFEDDTFDFVYTRIVLQHMPPELSAGYLRELVRVLRPGGALAFQVQVRKRPERVGPGAETRLPVVVAGSVRTLLRAVVGNRDMAFYKALRLGVPRRIAYRVLRLHPRIEMYAVDEQTVRAIVEGAGGQVVHVYADGGRAGHNMISTVFVATKPARPVPDDRPPE